MKPKLNHTSLTEVESKKALEDISSVSHTDCNTDNKQAANLYRKLVSIVDAPYKTDKKVYCQEGKDRNPEERQNHEEVSPKSKSVESLKARTHIALRSYGTGKFTSEIDEKHTSVFPSDCHVDFDSSAKNIYAHIDADSEYQGEFDGKGTVQSKRIIPSLLGVRDYVGQQEYLLEIGNYNYAWDVVFGTETIKSTKNLRSKGVVVLNIFNYYASNDIRFLAKDDSFMRDLLKYLNKRRSLSTEHEGFKKYKELPNYYIRKNGVVRRIAIEVKDVSALFGIASLYEAAENVGIKMGEKKLLDKHKHQMNDVWSGKLGENLKWTMGAYCLGDLINREIWHKANTELAPKLEKDLGLKEASFYFKSTIGATTALLVGLLIEKHLTEKGFEKVPEGCVYEDVYGTRKDVKTILDVHKFLNQLATPNSLRKETHGSPTTGRWLAKVDGGRAKNEQPSVLAVLEPIIDMDLGGAYASTMCTLTIPFGRPTILQYTEDKKTDKKYCLRNVLQKYEKEFLDGLWEMRVSTYKPFENLYQTLIQSQILPTLSKMSDFATDTDETEESRVKEIDKIDGSLTVLAEEIIHGTINCDVLETLRNICTRGEYTEILDNVYVDALIYYPKSSQVFNVQEVLNGIPDGTINPYKSEVDEAITTGYAISNKWYGTPLVDIVLPLLKLRVQYEKNASLNKLYKLINNTLYGVFASIYFDISNVAIASNITAKIRTAVWLLRVSCNTLQSITDGGAFAINKVHKKPDRISLRGLSLCHDVDNHTYPKYFTDSHISYYKPKVIPLIEGGVYFPEMQIDSNIVVEDEKGQQYKIKKIDEIAWLHTRKFFENDKHPIKILTGSKYRMKKPKDHEETDKEWVSKNLTTIEVDTTSPGQLTYESKNLFLGIVTHGQCDYALFHIDPKKNIFKARGKELKKEVYKIDGTTKYVSCVPDLVRGEIPDWVTNNPHPMKDLFCLVAVGEQLLPTLDTVKNYKMVSLNQYKHQSHKSDAVFVGDEQAFPVSVYPLSASQYIHHTKNQKDAWKKLEDRLRTKTGLRLEALFITGELPKQQDSNKSYLLYDLEQARLQMNEWVGKGKTPEDIAQITKTAYKRQHQEYNLVDWEDITDED